MFNQTQIITYPATFYYKAKYQNSSKHRRTHRQYLLNNAALPMPTPLQSAPQYRH